MTKLPSGQSDSQKWTAVDAARVVDEIEEHSPRYRALAELYDDLSEGCDRIQRERDELAHILFSYGDRLPSDALEGVWERIVLPVIERDG